MPRCADPSLIARRFWLVGALRSAVTPAKTPSAGRPTFPQFVDAHFAAGFAYKPTSRDLRRHPRPRRASSRISRARASRRASRSWKKELETIGRLTAEALVRRPIDPRGARGATCTPSCTTSTIVRPWEHNPMTYAGLPGRSIDALMKRDVRAGQRAHGSSPARLTRHPGALRRRAAEPQDMPPVRAPSSPRAWRRAASKFLESEVPSGRRSRTAPNRPQELTRRDNAARSRPERSPAGSRRIFSESTGAFALGEEQFLEKLKLEEMISTRRSTSCSRAARSSSTRTAPPSSTTRRRSTRRRRRPR